MSLRQLPQEAPWKSRTRNSRGNVVSVHLIVPFCPNPRVLPRSLPAYTRWKANLKIFLPSSSSSAFSSTMCCLLHYLVLAVDGKTRRHKSSCSELFKWWWTQNFSAQSWMPRGLPHSVVNGGRQGPSKPGFPNAPAALHIPGWPDVPLEE